MKILLPLAWIYGGIMAFRNWMFDHGYLKQSTYDVPVISIGNLAVGGTGKTPHTEYLLRLLTLEGRKCAMLSRGYGRKTKGFHEAQGSAPQEIGDEPWQVQRKFPEVYVCVCEKRVEGINTILGMGVNPEVILLDDAYQHRYVKPGFSILLTDFARPYYSDYVMPAGRLREFRSGARRSNLIVVTKCPEDITLEQMNHLRKELSPLPHQEIFFTRFDYGQQYAFREDISTGTENELKNQKVLLLCGIARPKHLVSYLKPLCKALDLAAFPDHHNFSTSEIKELGERSTQYDKVITTEKDAARLSGYQLPQTLLQKLWVQPIEVKFLNQESNKFNQIITKYVTENTRNSKMD